VACSSDDGTHYGPPDGLTGKMLPAPSMSADPGAGGGPDAGATDARPPQSDAGAACAVRWATDIFPNMTASGKWKCADSSCHGGFQAPAMSSDPHATYAALAGRMMLFAPKKLPYVLPGSTDPTASGIECNLAGTACGNQMPIGSGGAQAASAADLSALDTWVRCGSPEN
jgi:hypothetical protein